MLELWREFDLMPPQQIVLGLLDEPRPMGELAQLMHCDNSNMTGIVDRLEERGLVERRAAEGDRRVKLVALTDGGPRAPRRARRAAAEPPAEIAALSEADLRALRKIFTRALAAECTSLPLHGRPRARRAPTSILAEGTAVYSSDGEKLGKVEHVLADTDADIFDGLVIDRSVLPGRPPVRRRRPGRRDLRARGGADGRRGRRRAPARAGEEPGAIEVTGEDFVEREWDDELEGKLKRAWDFLSGKRTEDHRG